MDDSSVSQVSVQTVMKQQAYLLFYIQSNLPSSSPPTAAPASSSSPSPAKASELNQPSNLQKRKFSEPSSDTAVAAAAAAKAKVGNGSLRSNLDDGDIDEHDPLSDLLFFAKKQQLELPATVTQSKAKMTVANENRDLTLPSEKVEVTSSPPQTSRLPTKRFGIFR
jgi:hypothetical protein